VSRLLAPFTPFVADWLHRALAEGASVHLAGWPAADATDPDLEAEMDAARTLASLGRAARESVRIRVRQPLRAVHVTLPPGVSLREEVAAILLAELNVKEVHEVRDAAAFVTLSARPDFRALGPRFGKRTPAVAEAARAAAPEALAEFRRTGVLRVDLEGEAIELGREEVDIQQHAREGFTVESDGNLTAALDPTLDEALELEGLARELVNRVQRLRRDSGLEVQDRIVLRVRSAGRVARAVEEHRDFIMGETLALTLQAEPRGPDGGDGAPDPRAEADLAGNATVELDGEDAWIGLEARRP
jgi:isoleucyl-tRNA synthetase